MPGVVLILVVALATGALLPGTGLTSPAYAAAPPGAAEAFLQGNRQYRDGDFTGAVASYERVLALGVTAPELEYNLANAYLKAGEVGRAILHYRRALAQRPTYAAARENLRYARSLTKDVKPEKATATRWGWIGRVRLGPSLAAAALFFALTGFLAMAAVRMRRWRGQPVAGAVQGVLGALVLLFALALVFEWSQAKGKTEAVVVKDEIEVRAGPGREYTVSFRLHEGTEVEVLRASGDWDEIKVSEKLQGWAPRPAVETL